MSEPPILALDVDGVIIDGFPKNRWDETLETDLGIKPEVLFENFFKPHFREILIGNEPMMPVIERVFSELDIAVPAQRFVDYWHGKDANVRHDVIEAAKNWQQRNSGRLVLATNQEPVRAKYLWQDLAFKDHFELMIVSCELGAEKPEPIYFQRADELLKRSPGQPIIFIDDIERNVEGARAHGWNAVHASSCDHAEEILGQL